jgi:hypothetical protein
MSVESSTGSRVYGPVEYLTAETAFVLRDPDGQPADVAMLCLHDLRSFYALIGFGQQAPETFFRLSAISSAMLEVEPSTS